MSIAGSPDIFQGKMSELMESLEFVRAYLDYLLCISKLSLEDHLEKLEEVLRQLCNAGLKVNDAKLTFCALEIEYLGHVLTRGGIKPQSNKVQTILAIKLPTGVRELRHFLGMVQYYCENIRSGYLYDGDLVFVILKGIYGFKFPKRFLEISSRDLTSSLLFCQS